MKCSAHDSGTAGEFRQYAKAAARAVIHTTLLGEGVLMCDGEFERNEVEAITDRGYHNHVRGPKKSHTLLQSHLALGTFLELHRSGPLFVDILHHRENLGLGSKVVVSTLKGGDAHLNQHNLADPLWTAVEEALHAKHLERNALEAFHPIDCAEDDLAAELISDGEGPFHGRRVLKDLVQDRWLHAGMDGGDGNMSAVVVNGQVVSAALVGDHAVVQTE